jgi:hypothetical protein
MSEIAAHEEHQLNSIALKKVVELRSTLAPFDTEREPAELIHLQERHQDSRGQLALRAHGEGPLGKSQHYSWQV